MPAFVGGVMQSVICKISTMGARELGIIIDSRVTPYYLWYNSVTTMACPAMNSYPAL